MAEITDKEIEAAAKPLNETARDIALRYFNNMDRRWCELYKDIDAALAAAAALRAPVQEGILMNGEGVIVEQCIIEPTGVFEYSAGTTPWEAPSSFEIISTDKKEDKE